MGSGATSRTPSSAATRGPRLTGPPRAFAPPEPTATPPPQEHGPSLAAGARYLPRREKLEDGADRTAARSPLCFPWNLDSEAACDPSNIDRSIEFDPKFAALAPVAHLPKSPSTKAQPALRSSRPSRMATFSASPSSTLPDPVAMKGWHTSPSTPSRAASEALKHRGDSTPSPPPQATTLPPTAGLAAVCERLARSQRQNRRGFDDRHPSEDSELEAGEAFDLAGALRSHSDSRQSMAVLDPNVFVDTARLEHRRAAQRRPDNQVSHIAATPVELWTPLCVCSSALASASCIRGV